MDKLLALIGDAEDLQSRSRSSGRRKFMNPSERDDRDRRDDRHQHHHHHHRHHHETKSWKRSTHDDSEEPSPKKPSRIEQEPIVEPEPEETPTTTNNQDDEFVSEENLIELRKQLIRAELAGDDVGREKKRIRLHMFNVLFQEMTEMLRNEIKRIDHLRGNPQDDGPQQVSEEAGNSKKVLVMTTIDRYGVEKPVHHAHEPSQQRQHGHVDKRDRRKMKKEMRKMRQNDKDPERQGLSLQDLVEMERHSTSNMMPVLPGQRNTNMTADRHILASTRHLTGWSRIQALAEQKKRQKSFEQCWLCIENLSKSFIFGLLDHWFLCAPPQQSLTDGHCFLVPIQHSSSRFHLGKSNIR